MKKPAWVSFMGWLFLACLSIMGTIVALRLQHNPTEVTRDVAQLDLFAGVVSFVLWALGTLVYKVRAITAQKQVMTLAQHMKQVSPQPTVCGNRGPDGTSCDLPKGHAGMCRALRMRPQAVATSPLGLTGSDK